MSTQNLIDLANGHWAESVVLVDTTGTPYTADGNNAYKHIATSTTTTVKAAPGSLHSISVNTKGTVASTITVYDSLTATGSIIAVIDSLNLSGTTIFDVSFTIGLTIVTTGTVPPDVTVSYS